MQKEAQPVLFDIRTPVPNEGLRENVRAALARGHREIRLHARADTSPLRIIANGPSAAQYDGGKWQTLALNGALSLFREGPHMWAGCDPQPELAEFLTHAPRDTLYLIASKCHPRVFETLEARGCAIALWHVYEPATADLLTDRLAVGAGCSITTCSFELGAHLGYRSFDVWGWDACFGSDGACHAGQFRDGGSERITVEVDETRQFPTTHSWALEVEDARHHLAGFPFPITIHGGGLMGAALSIFHPHRIRESV